MAKSPFSDAYVDAGVGGTVRAAIDRHAELLVFSVADITTRDLTGVERIRRSENDRDYFYRYDASSVLPHNPPNVIIDSTGNNVFALVAQGWEPVAVVSGQGVFDMNENDKFLLTVDADCELQVPDGLDGEPFSIRVKVSGSGHTITLASGFQGDAPAIQGGAGQETVLSGQILDTSPSKTAFINDVKNL